MGGSGEVEQWTNRGIVIVFVIGLLYRGRGSLWRANEADQANEAMWQMRHRDREADEARGERKMALSRVIRYGVQSRDHYSEGFQHATYSALASAFASASAPHQVCMCMCMCIKSEAAR